MKKIQYKQTSIAIECDGGFSTITNELRYTISSNLTDAAEMQGLFPDKAFQLVDGKLINGGTVTLATMWDVIEMFQIEQADLGKSVKTAIITWSTNLIYQANLLGLNLSDWSIVE